MLLISSRLCLVVTSNRQLLNSVLFYLHTASHVRVLGSSPATAATFTSLTATTPQEAESARGSGFDDI